MLEAFQTVSYFVLAFGARTVLHRRRTGSSGFKGISGRPGSAEWFGGVLFVGALATGLAAPVLDLVGVVEPFAVLDRLAGLGVGLYGLGLVGTLVVQAAMGRSWRIGVEGSERTELVVAGPFALVRNPIFSAMIPAAIVRWLAPEGSRGTR